MTCASSAGELALFPPGRNDGKNRRRSRVGSLRGLLLSACLLAGLSRAEPPGVSHIFPAGGQRGTTVEFRVGGFYLHGHAAFEMTGGGVQAEPEVKGVPNFWIEGPMIVKPASQGAEDYPKDHAGRVTIAPDAAP